MHILNFLVFFWCSLDQNLPPLKVIRILSALVFRPSYDNTNRHHTQHIIKIWETIFL